MSGLFWKIMGGLLVLVWFPELLLLIVDSEHTLSRFDQVVVSVVMIGFGIKLAFGEQP